MSRIIDLKEILKGWPYDPDDNVRMVTAADDREILQVRLPLGIEQYEVEGRPDGTRPHGMESLLDYHHKRMLRARRGGKEETFHLSTDECAELFSEGTLYYFRYFHLFQLKDWPRTIRDTTRNLRLFDFVNQYAEEEDDQMYLEQWRPYLLRMGAVASAMAAWEEERHTDAIGVVKEAIKHIDSLEGIDDETFRFEQQRSLSTLRELVEQFDQTRPISEVERLQRQLERAIAAQNFEKAAVLRDQIRDLQKKPGK